MGITQKSNTVVQNKSVNLTLVELYKLNFDKKLALYKPSDKAFILANLKTTPTHELVNSFVKSVAEAAEEQFDKLANQPAKKIQ